MKRFSLTYTRSYPPLEHPEGVWVRYQDAQDLQARIDELEAGYGELTLAVLNAVQGMSGGQCKADLRDAYDVATEQLEAPKGGL